jgi:hypothetical protein
MPPSVESDRKIALTELDKIKDSLDELPLSFVLREQYARVRRLVPDSSSDQVTTLVREFHNNLIMEMTGHWFLLVPADKRERYEQRQRPFGDAVAQTFDDASKDICAASRCFALDEWTACVFHLMRVLEHGLRALAVNVGLGADAMAHENWKNVIDLIEAKIRAMEGLPKSPEKIARLKELSGLASQFRYFKDAWRNHVSHSHESYDEREASNVWHHVKTFMEQMAEISSPEQPA